MGIMKSIKKEVKEMKRWTKIFGLLLFIILFGLVEAMGQTVVKMGIIPSESYAPLLLAEEKVI